MKDFRQQWIDDMILYFFSSTERKNAIQKFLHVKFKITYKGGSQAYESKSQGGYKRRMQNTSGNITPRWQCFASPHDQERTYEQHQQKIAELTKFYSRPTTEPVSLNKPDMQSLTAVLNLIASINTEYAVTPTYGGEEYTRSQNYTRKGQFRRLNDNRGTSF